LLCFLGRIKNHQDEVARLGRRDDLATAPLAFGRALDDTRKIEKLDLGTTIFKDTRDGCEGCEGV
jgi:hypothetical protein